MFLVLLTASVPDTVNPCPYGYEECIVDFHSGIKVLENASVIVKEDIKVRSAGKFIKHGIYRDFPLVYKDRWGNRFSVEFRIKDVLLDDKPVKYFTKNLKNGIRIYIGDKEKTLKPGYYKYTLIYETKRQIGFFGNRDEIYWNATGNGWNFPIRKAEAVVVLPEGIPEDSVKYVAYTGGQGERGKDYRAFIHRNMVVFRTTRPLKPREGLTVAVAFPSGYVQPPSLWERLYWILKDNRGSFIAILGFILILLFYMWAWGRYGKDPARGVIMPRFKPPDNFSPAMVRYMWKMEFDNQALVANLIDLAVRGLLRIEEMDGGYRIVKLDGDVENLPEDERLIYDMLPDVLEIEKGKYNEILESIRSALKTRLSVKGAPFLRFNIQYTAIGWIFSILLIFLAFYFSSGGISEFMVIFLITGVLLVLNIAFYKWMKAPTREGRRILDEIEGFRLFLEKTEKERLKKLYPEDSIPRIFERFLPYALALGIEENWAGRFSDELESMGYEPEWYVGSGAGFMPSRGFLYASGIGRITSGLSEVVSSASTPPGSTSGMGGGGYSGGGGGGGGGGGW